MADKYRKEMLSNISKPLQYMSGGIYDAEENLLALMYREPDCIISPVNRDELARELVLCFNHCHPTKKGRART